MTRHDQLTKTLIQTFFGDFLRLVAPGAAERLRLEEATFLDKQSFTDWPAGDRRELDLLAEVPSATGPPTTVLVHVEIERQARAGMDRRIWLYYMQLRLRHGLSVMPIVVNLRGGPPGAYRRVVAEGFDDPETARFRYLAFGVSGCRAEDYLARPEPLAWAFASLMRPGRLSRAEQKIECLRRIAAARLNEVEQFLLANWVNTYLQLDGRQAAEYERLRQSAENREVIDMELTWADRMMAEAEAKAEAKIEAKLAAMVEMKVEAKVRARIEAETRAIYRQGKKEGQVESLQRIVLRQLEQRFGPLPDASRRRIKGMSSLQSLERLAEKVLMAQSFEEMGLGEP